MDAQEIAIDCSPIVASPERKNSLASYLAQRPTRDDLIGRHILPASNAHPSLLAHQQELERNMLSNGLQKALMGRPAPEKLVEEGILPEDPRKAA